MARSQKNRGKKRARKNHTDKATIQPTQEGEPKPEFKLEALEPRILLSATWVDADTGDALADATEGDDIFNGSKQDDVAYALGGNDELHGGNRNDQLFGGDGDDQLFGDKHNDLLDGGSGDDQLFGGDGQDTLISGGGNDFMDGGKHDDVFRFDGAQDGDVITVVGGQHNDTLDLSPYNNNQIDDDGTTLNVDKGGGESFTVNYTEIETIVTADGSYTPGNIDQAPVDEPPIAEAGTDQIVNEGDAVTLDATGSSDPEGQALTYTWTQTGGPSVNLSDANASQPAFTAPEGTSNTDLTFEVEASDGTNTSVDTVTVTVNADDDAPNAEAGTDQTVNEGDAVTLDATGSSDPEGQALTYTWTQTGGPAVSLSDAGATQPSFTAPEGVSNSTLTFQVTASDGTNTSVDTVTINVNADDDAPTAQAGADQTVNEGDAVTLDASGSTDPDSQGLTYTWTQTNGPTVTLSDVNAPQPTFAAPDIAAETMLTFQVEVSDGTTTSVDTVAVTVNPVADAPAPTQPLPPKAAPEAPAADERAFESPRAEKDTVQGEREPVVEIEPPVVEIEPPVVTPPPSIVAPGSEVEDQPAVTVDDENPESDVPAESATLDGDTKDGDLPHDLWDGTEDLRVMDAGEGLSQKIDIVGVEGAATSSSGEVVGPDDFLTGADDDEFVVIDTFDLPSSLPREGSDMRTGAGSDSSAVGTLVAAPAGSPARGVQLSHPDRDDTDGDRRADPSTESRTVLEVDRPSQPRYDDGLVDKPPAVVDTPQAHGFLARLWGALNGLVGTGSRAANTQDGERGRRR